jgi:DNA processing protein
MTEQAAVLALAQRARGDWYLVSQLLEATGSALRVLHRDWTGFEPPELLSTVKEGSVSDEELAANEAMIAALAAEGIRIVTVLDESYPTNLRLVYDRPPFLFFRGELRQEDERAVAVVGTRGASDEGLRQADRLARELVANDVAVLSGLAVGIDGAAHEGALAARGRTIAVMGTGIRSRIYPPEHEELAGRVAASGALVSQFLPDSPPARWSFPMRNRTMSGMAIGTVVVEASKTSGAKMQARFALEHGKRLFLIESLVMQEPWARKYAERPGAKVVQSVDDVLSELEAELRPVSQLSLT